jgi:hypothetical protein
MSKDKQALPTISPYWLFAIIVINLVEIVINYMALLWLYKLEEISCKCSQNWKRDYIKYFLYIYFVKTLINLLVNIYMYVSHIAYKDSNFYSYYKYILFIFNIIAFANLIIVIIYIDELKKNNCTCSEDFRREIYWYYNIILLALFVMIYIMMFGMMIYLLMILR